MKANKSFVLKKFVEKKALISHAADKIKGGAWVCFPYGPGPYNPGPYTGSPNPDDHNQYCVQY